MKRTGKILLWIFAVLWIITGFGMLSESILAGIFILLFGVSLCPLFWKTLQSRYRPKRWMRFLAPIALFIAASFVMPTPLSAQTSEGSSYVSQITDSTSEAGAIGETESDAAEKSSVKSDDIKQSDIKQSDIKRSDIKQSDIKQPDIRQSDTRQPDAKQLDELAVHFINVGQGDATLITCGNNAMLIDAGDNSKGTAVQNYLQKQGIAKLDYLIGTHPDSDHIGGLDVIITKFDCDKIIMPDCTNDTVTYRDVIDAMSYKGYKNTLPVVGQKYQLGDAGFTIIAPAQKYDDTNSNSVGILLSHGDKNFLFTGDAEEAAEADMVSAGIDIRCDVYQVGHHGSNTSSSSALLDAAKPEYAVISCGEGNSYGHPRAETLNNFRSRGIKVYRTDEQGTIIAKSDGKMVTFDESPSTTWIAGEPTGNNAGVDGNSAGVGGNSAGVSGNSAGVGDNSAEVADNRSDVTAQETQKRAETYILNTKTKKFHRAACGSLPTKNRKDTDMSRNEIVSNGYSPCKKCNP